MSTIDDEVRAWLSPPNPAYLHTYHQEIEVAQTLYGLRDLIALRAACQHLHPNETRRVLNELLKEQRAYAD